MNGDRRKNMIQIKPKILRFILSSFSIIFFSSQNWAFSPDKGEKEFLQRMLNRIILIASTTMGGMFIWSKYLEVRFLEGIFLIITLTSLFPYVGYLVAKKILKS